MSWARTLAVVIALTAVAAVSSNLKIVVSRQPLRSRS